MDSSPLTEKVKSVIGEIVPDAEIILYGSRARGTETAESDWDFLILVEGAVDEALTDRIRHRLYEVEWETGEVISSIIRSRAEWESLPHRHTPFHEVVASEGVVL